MRYLCAFVIGLLILFVGYSQLAIYYEYPLSPAEKEVDRILYKAGDLIEAQYDLKVCGTGAAMPDNEVQKLSLSFETKNVKTKDELRILLIDCANILLNQINSSEVIQQYLVKKPFTLENAQIIIFNCDVKRNQCYYPQVSTAQTTKKGLNYRSVDPENTYRYKTDYIETYEEAFKAIQQSLQGKVSSNDA